MNASAGPCSASCAAIALVAALDGAGTDPDGIDAALAVYEAERHGPVARIQDSARPSLSWWEHFSRSYRSLPPWQFAFHFFSRSLPESKLRQRDPGFVASVHRAWAAAHGGATDPLRTARLEHGAATMLVEDGSGDSVVEDLARTAILSGRADLVGTRND
jgi:2-polyprenyl-6-methoxyphenol hydroxylase-like FAD-dependent oxidoreductase